MKQPEEEKISRTEKALKTAYLKGQEIQATPIWHAQVMKDILNPETVPETKREQASISVFGQRIVWRFAAAACLFALVLSLYAVNSGINPDSVMAQMFFQDPAGFVTTQPFIP